MNSLLFDYNPRKAAVNLRKHGVSFEEAASAFSDLLAVSWFDEEHSELDDKRFIHIGLSAKRRILLIVHNEQDGLIRIISARPATTAERDQYEKG